MYVIFLFPLAFSIIAALQFAMGDCGLFTKITVPLLVVVSIILQFMHPLPELVHFLVPLGIQLIVCGWWYFATELGLGDF